MENILSFLKGNWIRTALIFGAISAVVTGCYLLYNGIQHRYDVQAKAALDAAYSSGVANAQKQTEQAANAEMLDAIKRLNALTADTNQKLAALTKQAQIQHQAIDTHNIDTTSSTDNEKWANDITNSAFTSISEVSK